MTARARTVGVMGGLGPAATCDFFARLLRESGAARDQDHLRLLIDCDPTIADRNAAIAGRGPSPGPALVRMAQGLERAGADFLVLVCNAAHHWEADIRAAATIPFLSMVEHTVEATLALSPRPARVGVIAVDACLAVDLYGRALARHGTRELRLEPAEQARFMELLYVIKTGDVGSKVRAEVRALAQSLQRRGAEALIAGCTELPLVLEPGECPVPCVSSTDVLVAKTIEFARAPLRARAPSRPGA